MYIWKILLSKIIYLNFWTYSAINSLVMDKRCLGIPRFLLSKINLFWLLNE